MHDIDLQRTDLNLLVILDVLLQERSVTGAARRLFKSQSAVSHALARLRDQLGDPLLVRVGGEMRPTPKAEHLAPELARLLHSIARVLGEHDIFHPATTTRAFTLVAPDFIAPAFPKLIARMLEAAPGASVEFVPRGSGTLRDVAAGRFDLAVAPPRGVRSEGLRSDDIAALEWVVFLRAGHPAIENWGAAAWARYPHVVVRTTPSASGPVDAAADAVGLARRVGVYVPHFMLVPPVIARTDLLATVPRATLAAVAEAFHLVTLPCPLRLGPIQLALHWSGLLDRDAAVTWFRGIVAATLREHFAPAGE